MGVMMVSIPMVSYWTGNGIGLVLWKWFFSLFKKTDAAMKRDLDELTVGPPNIRLASLGRLRSSVETNWAEILTHIALDLGDKLGVCMLHKDERLVKESLSFAILVVAWLTEDEEKSARPWGRVRAGDIAIAPKIQEHILVPSGGSNSAVLKPSRKKKIAISDAITYPGRPQSLIHQDQERKKREEQSAKRVLWNDALVSRVIRSAPGKETVCVVGSFRQMNGSYIRSVANNSERQYSGQENIRANFAGQWGSNCKKLKSDMTTSSSSCTSSSARSFWDFPFDIRAVFQKHCTRKQLVANGKAPFAGNLSFLDKVEYVNKDSKTRLVGYYLPGEMLANNPNPPRNGNAPAAINANSNVAATSTVDYCRQQYVQSLGLGHDVKEVLGTYDPYPVPDPIVEKISLTTESESDLDENSNSVSVKERYNSSAQHQTGGGGIPRNLLFWQLERTPRNVNYLLSDKNAAEVLSDTNLEIGIRVRHNLYGKGTVLGWRYNDAANRSSAGGLRVGDTSGGLCSRGYARVLFDDINKGKWNVPFVDCKVIGIAPLEIACYPLQWYDNSIDSLFEDTVSTSAEGISAFRSSLTSMLIPLSAHDSSPSRSPSPISRGAGLTRGGCSSSRNGSPARGGGNSPSPINRGRSPSPHVRERRMKKRLMRRLQRVCSWGDFLKRPHHKAFAVCRVKDRFLWGVAFGCCTQEDANVLAVENCLSKKRPREVLVNEPWLVNLDSVLYSFQEDEDVEGPLSPRSKLGSKHGSKTGGAAVVNLAPGIGGSVTAEGAEGTISSHLKADFEVAGSSRSPQEVAGMLVEELAQQKSFEKLNSLSRTALRYRYYASVAANAVAHWPCVTEEDVRHMAGASGGGTVVPGGADEAEATTTSSAELAVTTPTPAIAHLPHLHTATRLQLRAYLQHKSTTNTLDRLSPLRSLTHDVFDGWSDSLLRVVPLPDEQYDLTDPALRTSILRNLNSNSSSSPNRSSKKNATKNKNLTSITGNYTNGDIGTSIDALLSLNQKAKRWTVLPKKYTSKEQRTDGNILEGSSKAIVLVSWVDDDQEGSASSQMAPGASMANIDSFLNSLGVNGVSLLPQQDIVVTLDNVRKAFASDDGLSGGGNANPGSSGAKEEQNVGGSQNASDSDQNAQGAAAGGVGPGTGSGTAICAVGAADPGQMATNDESSNNFMPLMGGAAVTSASQALDPEILERLDGLDWMDDTQSESAHANGQNDENDDAGEKSLQEEQDNNNVGKLLGNSGNPSRSNSKDSKSVKEVNQEILTAHSRSASKEGSFHVVGSTTSDVAAGSTLTGLGGGGLGTSSSLLARTPGLAAAALAGSSATPAVVIPPGTPALINGVSTATAAAPPVDPTSDDDSQNKKLNQNYSETSLYSMLQSTNKSIFLPSQIAGLTGPGSSMFPCLSYTDDSIPELDEIYPYDFDACKKLILKKWWPILVKKLIYYTNFAAACGNSQNTRASSNKN
eukprot:g4188.t1